MKGKSLKNLKCSYGSCSNLVPVDQSCTRVICHMCVQGMVGIEPKKIVSNKRTDEAWLQRKAAIAVEKKKRDEFREKYKDFPRCWWLKKLYVHKDGRKFSLGKEIK